MSFTVAIVGRPNVGKSTLFNRLVGARRALVDDLPGVTRDRREGEGRLGDLSFRVIDTAGLEDAAAESLSGKMQAQTAAAVAQSDAVLFLVDARAGATPADRAFADLVRKSGKPAILIANKSEGRAGEAGALESYSLGLGDPIAISAEHGEGLAGLYEALREALPEATAAVDSDDEAPEVAAEDKPIRIAVVGRPNTGKSTLINRLLGEERLVTGPEAGITRDAIAVDLDWRGRHMRIHDTAGMRRRSRIAEKLEKLSVADTLNAIRFAEVVIVLVDATAPFEEQDIRIADLVEREGRAVVVAFNKVEWSSGSREFARACARRPIALCRRSRACRSSRCRRAPAKGLIALMAAVTGGPRGLEPRVPTAALNRFLSRHAETPSASGRSRPRVSARLHTQPNRGRRPSCCFRRARRRFPKPTGAI